MGAAAVSLMVLASCDQENVKSIYTPEQDNEVSFPATVFTNTEIPAEATTIDIAITRNTANGSITVPLSTNLPAEITVPTEVVFKDGEYEAAITLGLAIQGGIRYTGTISIADSAYFNAETSPYTSISVSLQQAYNWVPLEGQGQWWDYMMTNPTVVSVQVLEATNSVTPRYRIMNPFPDDCLSAFAAVQGGKIDNSNRTQYIEFSHLTDDSGAVTEMISFDTFYPGVTIATAGEEGPVQGVYSADYAKYCGLVEDFIYQFYPYYQFTLPSGSTYSWGQAFSAYLVLPGGPDLGKWLDR